MWKASKCTLGASHLDFIGYTVSAAGITPLERNLSYIEKLHTPRSVRDVRAVNFYSNHICGLAEIIAPLNHLLRKDAGPNPMQRWGPTEERAVERVRLALLGCTTTAFPDPAFVYQLYTDASAYAAGAVLTQAPPDCTAGPSADGTLPAHKRSSATLASSSPATRPSTAPPSTS